MYFVPGHFSALHLTNSDRDNEELRETGESLSVYDVRKKMATATFNHNS